MQTVLERADKSEGRTVILGGCSSIKATLARFQYRAFTSSAPEQRWPEDPSPPVSASKKTDEPYADVPEGEDKSEDGGLISVDRNSKATLPLTIPRPLQVVYEGSGAGKRRLGFDAGNAAELLSTSPAGRTRLGTGNTSAPLSLRLLRLPAARVSLLLAWILT